ncbi:GNAT family N-acetyltransferase [Phaeobacter inhibens]|nr:GNAT family N-acetyltransferase [Phaeobacter inhibens]
MVREMKFETDRLCIESWDATLGSEQEKQAFAAELAAILTPPVLKSLPEPMQLADGEAAISDWIAARHAESHVLTIRDGNASLIGLLILAPSGDAEYPPTVHIGYLFSEITWGKGFASELIGGLVAWYQDLGEGTQLLAGVAHGNIASAKALQKNGFEQVPDHSDPDTAMFRKDTQFNFDRLYSSTAHALGAPSSEIVKFFSTLAGDGLRVLDIGCGQGRDALFIARLGHSVVGVDIAPSGIKDLVSAGNRENLNVDGIVADITNFQPVGQFDVLLIDRTLHLLSADNRAAVLRRLIGHVAPQGWVIISDEPENMATFKEVFDAEEALWKPHMETDEHLMLQHGAG